MLVDYEKILHCINICIFAYLHIWIENFIFLYSISLRLDYVNKTAFFKPFDTTIMIIHNYLYFKAAVSLFNYIII